MKRREALKGIALASLASMVMSRCFIWDDTPAIELVTDGKFKPDNDHKTYLSQISETFLPLKDQPEGIPPANEYILTMLNDCHSEEDNIRFAWGFDEYKNLMKESQVKIETDDPEAVVAVVKQVLEDHEQDAPATPGNVDDPALEKQENLRFFIDKMRNLSIGNVTNSQLYLQDYMEYKLIPLPYEACVNITKNNNEQV
ncbi:MAG: hypothetical protein CL868_20015 [Cytophagaceae bacterium]|nr:hypothetical protein [Cytophagaceae bacterium]|tara:strand:- start:843 stop:1439 length:597 start_codon:yes stop_codon:yes gene_type:complete